VEASPLAPLARRVAEAQIGLERVRAARLALLALNGVAGGQHEPLEEEQRPLASAANGPAMLRDGSTGFSDAAPSPGLEPRSTVEPEATAASVGDIARRLARLDRYEARALSRRRSAIKVLEAALLKPE